VGTSRKKDTVLVVIELSKEEHARAKAAAELDRRSLTRYSAQAVIDKSDELLDARDIWHHEDNGINGE
jgi:hypothetical protein